MHSSIDAELNFFTCGTDGIWAKREKYFLFLRDHELRVKWRKHPSATNIDVETLLNYDNFNSAILSNGIKLLDFKNLWSKWHKFNIQYFIPILCAQDVINQIKNKELVDLTAITDVWTQSVIYYYIWLEFNVEVPHNDYSNWFTNTKEIVIMLNKLGVTV